MEATITETPITAKPNPRRVKITQRDRDLFDLLERYRWLTYEDIMLALDWSYDSVTRRVSRLEKEQYLDSYQATKYDPKYIALSNGGAKELAEARDVSADKMYWRWHNRDYARSQIPHSALIGSVMLKLLAAQQQHPTNTIVEEREVIHELPAARQNRQHPFAVTTSVLYNDRSYKKTVNPDQVFGVQNDKHRVSWFSLEADRGTHSVQRSDFANHRAIFPKLYTFYFLHRTGRFAKDLELENMRQVWVVKTKDPIGTPKRIAHMQQRALEATRGKFANLFLFASGYDIDDCSNLLEFEFQNAKGEPVKLAH